MPTVQVFGPEWIEKHAKASLHKASGIDAQESILRLHIYPFVGALRLDQVTDEAVADLKAKWIKGGHKYIDQFGRDREVKGTSAPKTINNRLTVLSSMLERATSGGASRQSRAASRCSPSTPCRGRPLRPRYIRAARRSQ